MSLLSGGETRARVRAVPRRACVREKENSRDSGGARTATDSARVYAVTVPHGQEVVDSVATGWKNSTLFLLAKSRVRFLWRVIIPLWW